MTTPHQRTALHTGGCQCGTVRFALYAEPDNVSICHCRMCQKASGNFFGAFGGVRFGDFAWTRGAPKAFRSSKVVARDFCAECGTPLAFRYVDKDRISIAIGALDHPERAKVELQLGIESRIAGFETLHTLPAKKTSDWLKADRAADLVSRQHPDRDS